MGSFQPCHLALKRFLFADYQNASDHHERYPIFRTDDDWFCRCRVVILCYHDFYKDLLSDRIPHKANTNLEILPCILYLFIAYCNRQRWWKHFVDHACRQSRCLYFIPFSASFKVNFPVMAIFIFCATKN